MIKKVKIPVTVLTLLVGLFCGSQCISAATITVGNDPSICPVVNFTTIQSAVNAAAAGDTVNVCPGTYTEQVTIEKNLTLRGIQVGSNKKITVRPNTVAPNDGTIGMTSGINRERSAIILVRRAAMTTVNPTVTIQNIIVDGGPAGNAYNGCAPEFYGIFYRNAGGSIIQNSVKNIRLSGNLFGCQTGLAIVAFADSGSAAGYNLFIQENVVDNFQKNGITVYGSNSPDPLIGAFIFRNTINGAGPSAQIGQNGIQLTDGITANSVVNFNTVSNMIYAPTTPSSTNATGILLFDITTGLDVQGNNVNRTDNAIGAYGVSNTQFRFNDLSNSTKYEGLYLANDGSIPSNGNTLNSNRVFHTVTTGIAVLGDNNSLTLNRVNDADIGIASNGNNTVSGSVINNVRLTQSIVGPTTNAVQMEGLNRGKAERSATKILKLRVPSFEKIER